jgi:hypothetical protein
MGRLAPFEWLLSHKARCSHALLFLLLWLSLLDFPREISIQTIDANWILCLGHFLANRYQCGVDYVWTYGPLGYLVHPVYDPDLFWWKYLWEVSIKLAMAWLLAAWADRLRPGWTRAIFVLMTLLFLLGAVDALYLFCLIMLGLLPLRDERWRRSERLAVVAILLAVLALTKFTFLLLGTAVWGVVTLMPGLNGRRRVALAAGYPLAWMIGWLLLGQSPHNVSRFLASSWEIVRGYGEAMVTEGSPRTVYIAGAALILFLVLLASYPFTQARRWEDRLGVSLLCASMFLAWKHGFIRQDRLHEYHFFGYLLFVPFAVEGLRGSAAGPPSRFRAGLAAALVLIGVLCRGPIPRPTDWLQRLCFNGIIVLTPERYKRSLDKQQEALAAEWALQETQQRVGESPADLISLAQGVLLLNRLTYRPRPIFQSYSAYTSDLLERNAAFYRSERAPPFVLCQLAPIDGRFPAMEDGPLLLELLYRYRPMSREKGFLLLKRRADADTAGSKTHPVLLQRTITFDEEVRLDELGSMPKLLSVHLENTLLGRLRAFLFRSPLLFLELQTPEGGTYSYRLIPGMAGSDFLLDPLLRDQADLEALYAGKPLPRVQSFSLHVAPEARRYFQERLAITVRGAEGL